MTAEPITRTERLLAERAHVGLDLYFTSEERDRGALHVREELVTEPCALGRRWRQSGAGRNAA